MVRTRLAAMVLLAAMLPVGCGPDAGDLEPVRTERCQPYCDGGRDAGVDAAVDAAVDTGPGPIPDEPLEDWDMEGAGALTGIFALEVTVRATVVVELEATQTYRLRLLQRGSEVRLKAEPCSVGLPSVPGVAELAIPPALDSLVRSKITEDEGAFLSAPDPIGATFTPPTFAVILGADLEEPLTDPLPTLEMPDSAIDEDEDGQPGVTIAAETLLCRQPEEAYIALRLLANVTGTIDDLDEFGGVVDATIEPTFLGFSDMCLSAAAELLIEPAPGSAFRAVRMGDAQDLDGNGNISCPEIAWLAPQIFPEEE